ncbi:hypothetical protein [Actinoplanes ianthinogenes]|uniref:hypothetical protein n=1 Tax=Actinoplanes ianthinogenes TaxID=122358 RepID=UPI00167137E3|nr:hypothetical protein [Actinoplanes ianthinogenes]
MAFGVGAALLLLPAGYVGFLALLITVFEVGSRILAGLAVLVAGAAVVCGLLSIATSSEGRTERAQRLILADLLLTVAAVVGALSIPTHGE